MVVNTAKETTARPADTLPIYEATDLTKDGDMARIKLEHQIYTLRITRAGKLILTK